MRWNCTLTGLCHIIWGSTATILQISSNIFYLWFTFYCCITFFLFCWYSLSPGTELSDGGPNFPSHWQTFMWPGWRSIGYIRPTILTNKTSCGLVVTWLQHETNIIPDFFQYLKMNYDDLKFDFLYYFCNVFFLVFSLNGKRFTHKVETQLKSTENSHHVTQFHKSSHLPHISP